MIISSKPTMGVLKVYGEQNRVAKATNTGKTQTQGKDEFILSSGAQEFAQIFNAIRATSDVRQDKVDEISSKINEGTYKVDSKSVAEKMLASYNA